MAGDDSGGSGAGGGVVLPDDPALREALHGGDPQATTAALRTGTVLLLTIAVDGGDRVVVHTGGDGQRVLMAFSGPGPLRRWVETSPAGSGAERAGALRGAELGEVAHERRVAAVVLDPAGPSPVSAPAEAVAELLGAAPTGLRSAAGWSLEEPSGPLAERLAALPVAGEVWLFERTDAGAAALTVGLHAATAAGAEQVRAALVATVPAGRSVDVVLLDDRTRSALVERAPRARVLPPPDGGGSHR